MLITIEFDGKEPIYQQIRMQIVRAMANGELVAGDSLPSVRTLAADLGINLHTVNKAYALLRDEGYVVMNRRSGAVIADKTSSLAPDVRKRELEQIGSSLRKIAFEHKAQGGSEEEFMRLVTEAASCVYGSMSAVASAVPPPA